MLTSAGGFPVSPGVNFVEIDLTTVVAGAATNLGAFAGVFRWGPVNERTLVADVPNLANTFGTPSNFNGETFFTIASFLAYGAPAWVVRAANCTTTNAEVSCLSAYANAFAGLADANNVVLDTVTNHTDYNNRHGTFDPNVQFIAKFPGALGNSLEVSLCADVNSFSSVINLASIGTGANLTMNVGSNQATVTINAASLAGANSAAVAFEDKFAVTDFVQMGNSLIGIQYLEVANVSYNSTDNTGNSTVGKATVFLNFMSPLQLKFNENIGVGSPSGSPNTFTRYWRYFSVFNGAPNTSPCVAAFGNASAIDQMHICVVDAGGQFTGVPGEVLETYQAVSRANDAFGEGGVNIYYADVINGSSRYLWFATDNSEALSSNMALVANATTLEPQVTRLHGGTDGPGESNVQVGTVAHAYDKFVSTEDVQVDLIMTGKAIGGIDGTQLPNYIVDNICSVRRDCVSFVSAALDDVVNNVSQELASILTFRNNLRNTSYQVLDTGYKYMYDNYNDVYRWVPLNGDIAGLCAQTDQTNAPWWSPAGFNRGNIKNVVKLAYNPRQADRDILYPAGVNPVVTFPQLGTVLFGDKTLFGNPGSAFSRINVRRLFITLERAISQMAKFELFEFNDVFTQNQFKAAVNPYLAQIQGARGITSFLVVCDSTNNTPQIIDNEQFVAAMYIKPARAINFILLQFVAVATGVAFNEVILGSKLPGSNVT